MIESSNYYVLFAGRVLAGLASSMLHSVFESWIAGEAKRVRASDAWLSDLFGAQVLSPVIVPARARVCANTRDCATV